MSGSAKGGSPAPGAMPQLLPLLPAAGGILFNEAGLTTGGIPALCWQDIIQISRSLRSKLFALWRTGSTREE